MLEQEFDICGKEKSPPAYTPQQDCSKNTSLICSQIQHKPSYVASRLLTEGTIPPDSTHSRRNIDCDQRPTTSAFSTRIGLTKGVTEPHQTTESFSFARMTGGNFSMCTPLSTKAQNLQNIDTTLAWRNDSAARQNCFFHLPPAQAQQELVSSEQNSCFMDQPELSSHITSKATTSNITDTARINVNNDKSNSLSSLGRLSINARERRRMHDLNDALDELRRAIPYTGSLAAGTAEMRLPLPDDNSDGGFDDINCHNNGFDTEGVLARSSSPLAGLRRRFATSEIDSVVGPRRLSKIATLLLARNYIQMQADAIDELQGILTGLMVLVNQLMIRLETTKATEGDVIAEATKPGLIMLSRGQTNGHNCGPKANEQLEAASYSGICESLHLVKKQSKWRLETDKRFEQVNLVTPSDINGVSSCGKPVNAIETSRIIELGRLPPSISRELIASCDQSQKIEQPKTFQMKALDGRFSSNVCENCDDAQIPA
ncbi:unnamed protein product, partial [Protopolystoma xenopodis]